MARRGATRRGRHGKVWFGKARRGWYGRRGGFRFGMARRGTVRQAWRGVALFGKAWRGVAGMAVLGAVRHG